jgi:hypothetical protein
VLGSRDSDGTCHLPYADARENRDPGKGQAAGPPILRRRLEDWRRAAHDGVRIQFRDASGGDRHTAQVRRPVNLYEPESNASRAASSKPIESI